MKRMTQLNQWESPYGREIKIFVETSRLHRKVLEHKLNQTGVYRSQHQLLMNIAQNPNASQRDIAQLHHASPATIAVSLKKLDQGGYIRRKMDQDDNRYNQIMITEKGQAVIDVSMKYFQQVENQMFAGLPRQDIEQFRMVLEKIKANLNGILAETERKE